MKSKFIIIFFIVIPIIGFSQNSADSEKILIQNMCNEFKNTAQFSDSLRIDNMYTKYLYPYFETIEPEKIDSTGLSIYYRLQRECEDFRKYLFDINKTENWRDIYEMPQIEFTSKQKKEFIKQKNFYYFESTTSDITKVKIKEGLWVDDFKDNTYSKNKFTWINDHQFVLEHIESDNLSRKGFSRKGDLYYYTIIKKSDNYYTLAVQIKNQKEILVFKLYVD